MPPSWLMDRCQRLTPLASATASTVPLTWMVGPFWSRPIQQSCQFMPAGAPEDLGHGFLGGKPRGQGAGVQLPLGRDEQPVAQPGGALQLPAEPLNVHDVYANANNHAAYSTVTLLARLRGWSTS